MRTAWTVAVLIVIQVASILVLRELAQVEKVRNADRNRHIHRLLEDQQQPGPPRQVSLRGVPQSVVPAPVEASWQNVLQESPKELHAGEPQGLPGVCISVFPAERHMSVVHAENPSIADRGAEYVP